MQYIVITVDLLMYCNIVITVDLLMYCNIVIIVDLLTQYSNYSRPTDFK